MCDHIALLHENKVRIKWRRPMETQKKLVVVRSQQIKMHTSQHLTVENVENGTPSYKTKATQTLSVEAWNEEDFMIIIFRFFQ